MVCRLPAFPAAAAAAATTAAAAATAEATTTAAAATGALARLADVQGAPLEVTSVERLDGGPGALLGGHLHEGEPARAAGVPVHHQLHLGDVVADGGHR